MCPSMLTLYECFFRNVNEEGLPIWNQYDISNGHYINIDINITTGNHLYDDRVKFWLTDVPEIQRTSGSTSVASNFKSKDIKTPLFFFHCIVMLLCKFL